MTDERVASPEREWGSRGASCSAQRRPWPPWRGPARPRERVAGRSRSPPRMGCARRNWRCGACRRGRKEDCAFLFERRW